MSNNKKIKKVFEKQFDIEIMKQEILSKEKEKKMNLKSIFKYGLVPICLTVIICGIVLINGNNKKLKPNIYEPNTQNKDNINLYINDISNISQGALRLDAEVQIINNINIPYYDEFKGMLIPNDFDNDKSYAIYVRNEKNSEHNVLNSYVFEYSNTKNNRNIRISFSKENKPIRDYYFSEDESKISKIDDIEFKIFKYNNLYFTEFNYKGINFDIETVDISEKELIDLLTSIIK